MSVGKQAGTAAIDSALTDLSVSFRNLAQRCLDLNQFVNGQGTGSATLQAIGYSAADATTALQYIGYLTTLSQVFNGTATQATQFNFANALAPLSAGQ